MLYHSQAVPNPTCENRVQGTSQYKSCSAAQVLQSNQIPGFNHILFAPIWHVMTRVESINSMEKTSWARSLLYSVKFLNGANFHIFQMHTNCVKIRTYQNFIQGLRDHAILCCTANFCLFWGSRYLCKRSHISLPWWWKKRAPRAEKF